jgi:hypothetical protein
MTKQDKQFTGVRTIGKKKSNHKNIMSEMSEKTEKTQDSDTEAMRSILNSNTEERNSTSMFLKMNHPQQGQQMMMNQNMMGQQMMNQNMMNQNMMGQNMADVDPLMVHSLAPVGTMNNMDMGHLMNGAQMAQGLGKLGQISQGGLNIPQSFEMSEAAQMSQMSQQMGAPMMNGMMGQQLGQMLGQQMGQQMGTPIMNGMMGQQMGQSMMNGMNQMMGQQMGGMIEQGKFNKGMLKNIARLNQIKMI